MERTTPSLLDVRKRARHVAVTCLGCGHKAVISLDALIQRLGAHLPFTEIKRKVRCKKCRGADVHIAPIWPDPLKERERRLKGKI